MRPSLIRPVNANESSKVLAQKITVIIIAKQAKKTGINLKYEVVPISAITREKAFREYRALHLLKHKMHGEMNN